MNEQLKLSGWIHGHESLSPSLNWACYEIAVLRRLFPPLEVLEDYVETLRETTRFANALLFSIVRDHAAAHQGGPAARHTHETIRALINPLLAGLIETRERFIAANQDIMMHALESAEAAPARLPVTVAEPT